jgi:hypothetical protein
MHIRICTYDWSRLRTWRTVSRVGAVSHRQPGERILLEEGVHEGHDPHVPASVFRDAMASTVAPPGARTATALPPDRPVRAPSM